MPTPDDVVSPVEHERAICPPEDSRTSTVHETLIDARDSDASNNVDFARRPPIQQQPTPPPHGTREQSPAETHSKPPGASIEAPNRDIPTPMTVVDDSAEDQRASQASPLSATAPAPTRYIPSHLAAPFPAHRVCAATCDAWQQVLKSTFADRHSFFPSRLLLSCDPAADSKAVKPQIVSSTRLMLRSNMLICANRSCVDICAFKARKPLVGHLESHG